MTCRCYFSPCQMSDVRFNGGAEASRSRSGQVQGKSKPRETRHDFLNFAHRLSCAIDVALIPPQH